ncbi:cytochrome c2 domain protein [Collimonas arenae]|uniref:Cytochrome c2 domain protein n=1 Tax=Collimonas arenae TaxID=279058 RepID=A0A127PJN6_9BURK|nr:cytochrome c family protein [Collimonas arenae]AMO98032.1 cytochrome c2 domain protein [Collimonas arenae]AMP07894.1 cytochrome c2 domain protein [Collimonas arenae]
MYKQLLPTLILVFQLSAASAAGDPIAGKAAFAKCASCHQVGPSARGGFGPQLNGIIGRPAASTKDYKYSQAMQSSGIVWSEQKLRAFLKAPGDVVPGTKMRFFGIGSDTQIDNLLAYLRTSSAVSNGAPASSPR